jgi:hypothetical protein
VKVEFETEDEAAKPLENNFAAQLMKMKFGGAKGGEPATAADPKK